MNKGKDMISLLYLEDDKVDVELVESILEAEGIQFKMYHAANQNEFIQFLEESEIDIVICDYSLPGFDGTSALQLVKKQKQELPVIMLSGTLGEEAAVETLKKGATDYVLKDNLKRLVPAIIRALKEAENESNRIQAEKALSESERKYRNLFECSNDAVFLINENLEVLDSNLKACELIGQSKKEMMGQSVEQLFKKENAQENQLAQEFTNVLHGGSNRFELGFTNRKNQNLHIDVSTSVFDPDTNKIQAVIRDVSERRKQIEKQEKLIQILEIKISELERFNYITSHDLKTPLFTIKGFLSLVLQDIEEENYDIIHHDIQPVLDAVDKMAILLDSLLKIDQKGRSLDIFKEVDLNQIMDDVLFIFDFRIIEKNIEIKKVGSLPVILGDEDKIREAFIQMMENAIKFSRDDMSPVIEIGNRSNDDFYDIYFQDNGKGVPSRYLTSIFDIFTKLDHKTQGQGVGLTLVKKIAQAHNGVVWVESAGENQGARFVFRVPKMYDRK